MKYLFAILVSLLSISVAAAEDIAPDAMVRSVSSDVLDIVHKDKDIQSGNIAKAV